MSTQLSSTLSGIAAVILPRLSFLSTYTYIHIQTVKSTNFSLLNFLINLFQGSHLCPWIQARYSLILLFKSERIPKDGLRLDKFLTRMGFQKLAVILENNYLLKMKSKSCKWSTLTLIGMRQGTLHPLFCVILEHCM